MMPLRHVFEADPARSWTSESGRPEDCEEVPTLARFPNPLEIYVDFLEPDIDPDSPLLRNVDFLNGQERDDTVDNLPESEDTVVNLPKPEDTVVNLPQVGIKRSLLDALNSVGAKRFKSSAGF